MIYIVLAISVAAFALGLFLAYNAVVLERSVLFPKREADADMIIAVGVLLISGWAIGSALEKLLP